MTSARELLDCLAEIGATVRPAGDNRLIVRAGPKPVPAELVRRLRDAKFEILALVASPPESKDREKVTDLAAARHWRDRFAARIDHWSLDGLRPWREAELLAFADMILDWHRLHGARPDPGRCAGCGDEIPSDLGLRVDRNGGRVHFDGVRRDDCIIAYGQRWRGAAGAALQAFGIDPPEGFEL
jgi:hypothetical protein